MACRTWCRSSAKDIFTVDFSKASVVTLYLLPWMNKKWFLSCRK